MSLFKVQVKSCFFLIIFLSTIFGACSPQKKTPATASADGDEISEIQVYSKPFEQDIKMKDYYSAIEKLIEEHCKTNCFDLTEHTLINANPRIIDTLAGLDYYQKMKQGIFIFDQKEEIVFRKGDSLLIPGGKQIEAIKHKISAMVINVNIPEYKLRVIDGSDTLYTFPVRVGANKQKYLEIAGRMVSLNTRLGIGEIVRLERNPWHVSPATGKRYDGTNRDDGRYTKMPLIPWMEPSVNGIRHGDLIHPTTNQETLGKAYSHGCIGLNEGDAWRVYYSLDIGTKVVFRYDLKIRGENGDSTTLADVYELERYIPKL